MPSTKHYFLSIEEYSERFNYSTVNCLFTALINPRNIGNAGNINAGCHHLDTTKEIGESFLSKIDDLEGFLGYGREAFQRLNSIEEGDSFNQFRLIFGHQPRTVTNWNPFLKYYHEEDIIDFHVVIGVRSDGKVRWYHKFGWSDEPPREVSNEDWKKIWEIYTYNPPVLFAFAEPEC